MVQRLQSLPNIGQVAVSRVGPTPWKEYSWFVTFLSMPGSFPDGTGYFSRLMPAFLQNNATLGGNYSGVSTMVKTAASVPLAGTFSLTFVSGANNNVTETASGIPADASADEVAAALSNLKTIGSVSVSRVTVANGYRWLVTFDSCDVNSGLDVCNEGRLPLMIGNGSHVQCGGNTTYSVISVREQVLHLCEQRWRSKTTHASRILSTVLYLMYQVVGSGPGACPGTGVGGKCVGYVNALTSAAPYSYLMTGLTPGLPYYVRVRAHNAVGYGAPAISQPSFQVTFLPISATSIRMRGWLSALDEYLFPRHTAPLSLLTIQVPTYLPPGAPPPPRLVSSTASSITVGWDYPRINGGATVMGFELWMDEWAGGNPRLVFDGTDQPTVQSFTVNTASSFGVQAGKSYRFMVRAVNYCIVANNQTACLGAFSDTSVFAARAPRLPLPPPMPYRSSLSNMTQQV